MYNNMTPKEAARTVHLAGFLVTFPSGSSLPSSVPSLRGLPRFPSLSGPFGLSLPPSSCRPKGPVRSRTGPAPPGMVMSEGESRKASTEGDTRPRSREEGWPCTGESFSEFNRQSRKVQHSPFFPALGTKPPGEEKCTGEVKSLTMNDPVDARREW